jgi:hypothetical protein
MRCVNLQGTICNEFAQHKKIIGKKMPIFAQEYKIAK